LVVVVVEHVLASASLEELEPLEFRSLLAMVEGFGDGLRRGGRGG